MSENKPEAEGALAAKATLWSDPRLPRMHLRVDATERSFTEFREAVRAYPTFGRVVDEERAQIERDVFAVVPRFS